MDREEQLRRQREAQERREEEERVAATAERNNQVCEATERAHLAAEVSEAGHTAETASSAAGFMANSIGLAGNLDAMQRGPQVDRTASGLRAGGNAASLVDTGASFANGIMHTPGLAEVGERAGHVAGGLNLAATAVDISRHGATDANLRAGANGLASFASPPVQASFAAGQFMGDTALASSDRASVSECMYPVTTTGRDGQPHTVCETGTQNAARQGEATRQRLVGQGASDTGAFIGGAASTLGHQAVNTVRGVAADGINSAYRAPSANAEAFGRLIGAPALTPYQISQMPDYTNATPEQIRRLRSQAH